MNCSFYISVDLNLKTLSDNSATLEELLIAFIESTMKQKGMSNALYKLEMHVSKLDDSVSPEREQKLNRLG